MKHKNKEIQRDKDRFNYERERHRQTDILTERPSGRRE